MVDEVIFYLAVTLTDGSIYTAFSQYQENGLSDPGRMIKLRFRRWARGMITYDTLKTPCMMKEAFHISFTGVDVMF